MIIKRTIFPELKKHSAQKEISLIVGPRQAGKTTLMLMLNDYLEKKGKKTLFLNLDIEADSKFLTSQDALLAKIRLEIGERGVVFIDEMQRKENAGLFLKGIFDMNLPYKFVVSGSGSLELKGKIQESLAGRKRTFELSTLSFDEFFNHKTNNKYENKMSDYFALEKNKTEMLLREYLGFGGYPRVVLSETIEEKRKLIDEIYRSYLEKDIHYLLGIKKGAEFAELVRILASQVGNIINFSELSRTVGLSVKTIKEYMWYLEKTFIVYKIRPFFRNLRKEITKSPVIYFHDTGFRNYALGTFDVVRQPHDMGFLFENFIGNILKDVASMTPFKIHFWRTTGGAEVDFVVDLARTQVPIEVKYKALKSPEINRSFRSFLTKYKPPKALVINLGLEADLPICETNVKFLPFYKLREEI